MIEKTIRKIKDNPVIPVLLLAAVLYLTGINWGLPGKESWYSDSLAPFHPLLGLTRLFSFGYLHKYPLVHQFLLAIINIPVVIVALFASDPSNGMSIFKLVNTLQQTSFSTALIFADRLVSVAMGVGTVYYIYLITKELFSRRAAVFAALVLVCNGVFCLNAHLAKVEVPYLFWGAIAIYYLLLAVKNENKDAYIKTAIFATLSFGSKDQGYALFILPFLWYLIVEPLIRNKEKISPAKVLLRKNMLFFSAFFIGGTVITQNMILNWSGFVYRFKILTGWNSERSKAYTATIAGQIALLQDIIKALPNNQQFPLPLFVLSLAGIIIVICKYRHDRRRLSLGLLPLLVALSFYIFFIALIKQTNLRHLIPLTMMLGIYSGMAIDVALNKAKGFASVALKIALTAVFIYSFYFSLSVSLNLTNDLRYSAEKWMKKTIAPGSVIEYYSYLHYLPRFPEGTVSYRVTARPFDLEKRNPDYIVLTSHYYPRFIRKLEYGEEDGRVKSTKKQQSFAESDMSQYMPKLLNGETDYELIKKFTREKTWFKQITHAHISPKHLLIFARKEKN